MLFFIAALILAFTSFSCGKKTTFGVLDMPDAVFVQQGDSISAATFDTLSKTLRYVMQTVGADSAVRYCHVQAYPITAVYASKGIQIRRTSLKYRNPANEPDVLEYLILNEYNAQQRAGLELKPAIRRNKDGTVHYFKPILLQGMCVTCHGDPASDIPESVKNALSTLYPNDQATGYRVGDLRGMWHIQFER
jgi:hypothetical protein